MAERSSGPFGVVLGRYELIEIIGSGGMGVVYRAHDSVLGRPVAVKMIRQELAGEEFVKRFEREAAILARLRSPHIVVVYDYGEHESQFFLVTDYLAEGDLAGWLDANGPMPVQDAVPLVARLAEGLADAHELGVLHRDIKPANVLLWKRGGRLQPVLGDFGIAVTSDLSLTKTGAVVGSPLYMAPERHLGEPATVASDIYAMGCLLYALVTGSPPFWGTEFQAATAHVSAPIPQVPAELSFAREIDDIVAQCMAKRPQDRLASADDLAARLEDLAHQISPPRPEPKPREVPPPIPAPRHPSGQTTVLSPTSPPPLPPERSRRPFQVVGAVMIVALTAVGGWWLSTDDDPERDPDTRADGVTSSATSTTSEGGPPPAAPDVPEVEIERGYREVAFRPVVPAARDGVTFRIERDDGGWKAARSPIVVETVKGGAEECVRLRLVARSEAGSTPGEPDRFCGRADPSDIELLTNPEFGTTTNGNECRYWDIRLLGFAPGPVDIDLLASGGGFSDPQQYQVVVDPEGYGVLGARIVDGVRRDGGICLTSGWTDLSISVGKLTRSFVLAEVRD